MSPRRLQNPCNRQRTRQRVSTLEGPEPDHLARNPHGANLRDELAIRSGHNAWLIAGSFERSQRHQQRAFGAAEKGSLCDEQDAFSHHMESAAGSIITQKTF